MARMERVTAPPQSARARKVAAYARISMENDRTPKSLSAQISRYSELIQSTPGWEYAGVYADSGISGTTTNRPQFQAMLAAARSGQIDLILTKSISRFARNTRRPAGNNPGTEKPSASRFASKKRTSPRSPLMGSWCSPCSPPSPRPSPSRLART